MALLGGVEGFGDGDLFAGGAGDGDLFVGGAGDFDLDFDLLVPSDFDFAVVVLLEVFVGAFDAVGFFEGTGFVTCFVVGGGFKSATMRYTTIIDPTVLSMGVSE